MGPKSKKGNRRHGIKMTKGRPKISRVDEENQSLALFDNSIPTTKR